jgi:hypothetical protein
MLEAEHRLKLRMPCERDISQPSTSRFLPQRWPARRRRWTEPVPLIRTLVILDWATAGFIDQFDVLDLEPLLEDLHAPVSRPHVFVREPAIKIPADDFPAGLLKDLLGVCRILVVRCEYRASSLKSP